MTKTKKPIFKKWWFYILITFVLFVVIGSLGEDTSPLDIDSEIKSQLNESNGKSDGVFKIEGGKTDKNSRSVWFVITPSKVTNEDDMLFEIQDDVLKKVKNLYKKNKDLTEVYFMIYYPLANAKSPLNENNCDKVITIEFTRKEVEDWDTNATMFYKQFKIAQADKKLFPSLN